MKIVLIGVGSRGDVQPMVTLALAARAAGHDPVVCAGPNFGDWVRGLGLAFRPAGVDVEALMTGMGDVATGGPVRNFRAFNGLIRDMLAAQFAELPAVMAGADLVLGGGLPLAVPSIADAHGIPFHLVVFCPVLLRSAHHPPFMVPWQRLPRWANRAFWWANHTFYNRLLGPMLNGHRAPLGLRPLTDAYGYFLSNRVVMAADEALAPVPPDVHIAHVRAGFLALPEPTELDPELEAFLRAGDPPVYFGFGSMPDPDPDRTTQALVAAAAKLGRRAVISRGWARFGRGSLPPTVRVIGPVPHGKLFPRVAAVVHHGGAGTTSTAARAGVPQVVVPHGVDQAYWAERVRSLGLGPAGIPRTRLTADALAVALRCSLDARSCGAAARDFGRGFRPATGFDALLASLRAGPRQV